MSANISLSLISALRVTASNMQSGTSYHWGHMGSCNCGNLAQVLTNYTKAELHAFALISREGDWSEQTDEYCPASNLPMDKIIDILLSKGLTTQDLKNLEYLRDEKVLNHSSIRTHSLNHTKREDVISYLLAWADLLEEELLVEAFV